MGEGAVNGSLQRAYEAMVSGDVGPFLRARGFDISACSFKRERGPVYDMIYLQPDWHNGTMAWHGFFVNVGIGSAEVDAACPGYERARYPLKGSLLQRRWEDLVPDLPYEVRFDHRTDMRQFAAALCDSFDLVLAEMEQISTTKQLVRYAVDNNLLIEYDKTCRYLAAIDDIDTLTEYVTRLHDCFGHQDRWSIFSREISTAAGRWARELGKRGLRDPSTTSGGCEPS
ncbi:hypothetical protein DQP55_13765 [Mycolicibacterium sp. GF69]|uniref:DUF4304 domain-containing protein n=1 Tax=Mycolicibacterium sp. GF69 TaxID=2267251 RepID=UPI000DCE242B|nr:DUF4304 domain-containing protein [Mycolicibacterium sp. GF69]RAV11683.1 hypothetical protein DQP55_13765 [Mycolicibacterium sp. GF69]